MQRYMTPLIHPPSDYVFKPTDRALPPTGVVAVENGGPVLALELNTDSMGQLVAIDMVRTALACFRLYHRFLTS